ncbi:MAG: YggS family pyridoxal phosphate-dependent enzyme, partial [Flexibacteraceae bacterium]
ENETQIAAEFEGLKQLFEEVKIAYPLPNTEWKELSMGMSGDYKIALEHGSTMVRIGSSIFGHRSYAV